MVVVSLKTSVLLNAIVVLGTETAVEFCPELETSAERDDVPAVDIESVPKEVEDGAVPEDDAPEDEVAEG